MLKGLRVLKLQAGTLRIRTAMFEDLDWSLPADP